MLSVRGAGYFHRLWMVKSVMSIVDADRRHLSKGWMELGVLAKSRNETFCVLDAVKPNVLISSYYSASIQKTTYKTNP